MKNLQLTDEIKQAFESIDLPEIDVSDSVINSIRNADFGYTRKKNAIVYGLLAAVLFITASAFTALKIWTLKDGNNNIILRYQEFNEENPEPYDISSDTELQNKIDNLEPGKALIFYDAMKKKRNSETLTIYSRQEKYTDLDVIMEKAGFDFAVPSSLPEGYTFSEGGLNYEPLQLEPDIFNEVISKLKEETRKTGKNTATLEWETSSKVLGVSLLYKNGEKEFRVNVSIANGEDMYADLKDSKFKNLTVNGKEILYIEKDNKKEINMREPYGQSTVKTFEDGKSSDKIINTYIHYSILSKDLSREELINIVQGMIS
jgi:hypothetical protein